MSRMTIEDLDREIAEAEQRRANAVEAGWPKGVRQMDKRLKKLNKKRDKHLAKYGPDVHPSPLALPGRRMRTRPISASTPPCRPTSSSSNPSGRPRNSFPTSC